MYVDGELYENTTGGATGYNVSIIKEAEVQNIDFYSLDNGNTWNDLYPLAGTTLTNVAAIKFKATRKNGSDTYGQIVFNNEHTCEVQYEEYEAISDNFTLTMDSTVRFGAWYD